MNAWLEAATALGTVGAALAAAYAAKQAAASTKASVGLVAIERERREAEQVEAGAARLRPALQRTTWKSYRVVVENFGPGAAEAVTMELFETKSRELYDTYMPPGVEARAAVERLEVWQQLVLETATHSGGISLLVVLAWWDSKGPHDVEHTLDDDPRE